MSYQSDPRAVEESYDHSVNTGLLPGINSGVNSGASNSARGEGTTAAELGTKFRMLNCCACLFVLLFHTLRIIFNPVRLTMLLASPVRLVLEAIVGLLALSLLLIEARAPILGEKALKLMTKLSVGGNPLIDLDVARGRALALIIVGGSLGMINHLNRGVSSKSGGGDPYGGMDAPSANATDIREDDTSANDGDAGAHAIMPFVILQSILSSPTAVVAFALAGYTLYAINTFPEYAESRAYSIQDGSEGAAASSSVPSWAGNVGDIVQGASSSVPSWVGNVGDMARGSGYQNVSA